MSLKTFPVRAKSEFMDSVQTVARRNNVSANALWVAAMEAYLKAEDDKAWAESFASMADDAEATDVEYARFAQAEVMLANPS